MGSYCQFFITAECPAHVEQDIIKFANSLEEFKSPPLFDKWCWKKWSESSKWCEDRLMQNLSTEFPNVMFKVHCKGDYSYVSFWLGGSCLDESQIWVKPKFPTAKEFKDAKVRVTKQEEARRAEQEKVRQEKELADAKARLVALEQEKKDLENKLKSATK